MHILFFLVAVIGIIVGKRLGNKKNMLSGRWQNIIIHRILVFGAFLIPVVYFSFSFSHFRKSAGFYELLGSLFVSILLYWFWLNSESSQEDQTTMGWVDMDIDTDDSQIDDDLTAIEGIGPKIQELLYGNGIRSYEQLALTTIEDIKKILDQGGSNFKQHDPATRPRQAFMASQGDWEQLKIRQEELDGGKL